MLQFVLPVEPNFDPIPLSLRFINAHESRSISLVGQGSAKRKNNLKSAFVSLSSLQTDTSR